MPLLHLEQEEEEGRDGFSLSPLFRNAKARAMARYNTYLSHVLVLRSAPLPKVTRYWWVDTDSPDLNIGVSVMNGVRPVTNKIAFHPPLFPQGMEKGRQTPRKEGPGMAADQRER